MRAVVTVVGGRRLRSAALSSATARLQRSMPAIDALKSIAGSPHACWPNLGMPCLETPDDNLESFGSDIKGSYIIAKGIVAKTSATR